MARQAVATYSTVTYIDTEMGAHIQPADGANGCQANHSIETATYSDSDRLARAHQTSATHTQTLRQ